VRVIPDYATRLLELEGGGVDMMQGLQMEDLPRLQREHPEIRLHSRGFRKTDFVVWNLRDERFADVRVRTALAHAVDVDTLIEALLTVGPDRYGRRAVGTIPPVLCQAHHDGITPLAHDPARARELFAEAGWTDSDGDGWLDRDGQRLAFTLLTNSGNARREKAQVILQEQLRAAGVDVRLEAIDSNAFRQRLREGDFEAVLWGMFASLFVDPSNRWQSGDRPDNFGGYASAEVDALIERGLSTTDPDEALRCWREMQAEIHADQPYLFLYWRSDVVGIHQRFRDANPDVLGLFSGLEDWWVPVAEQRRGGGP
jgi:peptide/nickel transport system substrate-binding protein